MPVLACKKPEKMGRFFPVPLKVFFRGPPQKKALFTLPKWPFGPFAPPLNRFYMAKYRFLRPNRALLALFIGQNRPIGPLKTIF